VCSVNPGGAQILWQYARHPLSNEEDPEGLRLRHIPSLFDTSYQIVVGLDKHNRRDEKSWYANEIIEQNV